MKQLILEKNEIHEKHVKENKEPKIFDQVKCLPKQMNSLFGFPGMETLPLHKISIPGN